MLCCWIVGTIAVVALAGMVGAIAAAVREETPRDLLDRHDREHGHPHTTRDGGNVSP